MAEWRALKDYEAFPADVQLEMRRALTVAAEGGKADKAKPFKGVEGGVFEIALRHRGDAYRLILRRAARYRSLGDSRLSEEVKDRNQNTAN